MKFIEEIPTRESSDLSADWRLKLDLNENIYEVSDLVLNSLKNTTKQEVSLYCNPDKLINKLNKHDKNILLNNIKEFYIIEEESKQERKIKKIKMKILY